MLVLDMMKTQESLSELPGTALIHKDDPLLVQVKPELGKKGIVFYLHQFTQY
jgi:hypothetical protein